MSKRHTEMSVDKQLNVKYELLQKGSHKCLKTNNLIILDSKMIIQLKRI